MSENGSHAELRTTDPAVQADRDLHEARALFEFGNLPGARGKASDVLHKGDRIPLRPRVRAHQIAGDACMRNTPHLEGARRSALKFYTDALDLNRSRPLTPSSALGAASLHIGIAEVYLTYIHSSTYLQEEIHRNIENGLGVLAHIEREPEVSTRVAIARAVLLKLRAFAHLKNEDEEAAHRDLFEAQAILEEVLEPETESYKNPEGILQTYGEINFLVDSLEQTPPTAFVRFKRRKIIDRPGAPISLLINIPDNPEPQTST